MSVEVSLRKLVVDAVDDESISINYGNAADGTPFPHVNIHLIDDPGQHTLNSIATSRRATFQIDVFSPDVADVIAIANKLRRLDGYKSGFGVVRNIMLARSRSDADNGDPSNTIAIRSFDFDVFYLTDAVDPLPGQQPIGIPEGQPGQYLGYDEDGNLIAMDREAMETVAWVSITDKPVSFPPDVHTHDWDEITDKPSLFDGAYSSLTGVPSEFTPSVHTHVIADVTGLQPAIDSKADADHVHNWDSITDKPSLFDGAYSSLSGIPSSFSPSAHTHSWEEITDKPSVFAPAPHRHDASEIDNLPTGDGPASSWSEIIGKPLTYPPEDHTHSWDDVTDKPALFDGAYGSLTGVPSSFTPSAHTHIIGDVTGLQSALDAKANTGHTHSWTDLTDRPPLFDGAFTNLTGIPASFTPSAHTHSWAEVTDKPTSFPADAHTHVIADVTGLQSAIDAKANSNHIHSWADLTDRPSLFDGDYSNLTGIPSSFSPSAHTHTISDVTGLQTAIDSKANTAHTHTWDSITSKPAVIAAGADAAAARTAIGAGTSNLVIGTTASTAKAGNYAPTWAQVTSKPAVIAAGTDAAAARTAIGLGTAATAAASSFATAAQGALADTAVQPATMQAYTAPVRILTQAQYDALSPPDANTVYVVT